MGTQPTGDPGGHRMSGEPTGDQAAWREERRRAASAHAAELERLRATEAIEARRLIADFVREATERDVRPQELTARSYTGSGRYRTGLRGWYLRRDRSIAVGTNGEFYILSVPAGLRARLFGATVSPQEPPLVVGRGGRDGESMPLATLLRQRLDAGNAWAAG